MDQAQYMVVQEDRALLAVNKLSPLPVLPDLTGDPCLRDLLRAERGDCWLEAAHRLDRRTSGLILFAKNKQMLADISAAFQQRRVSKIYWAVVENSPPAPSGTVRHRLVHDSKRNVSRALPPETAGKGDPVELRWELLGSSEQYFLLSIQPLTGKTHQIRAQLAALGCPIRGDLKYGARRSCANGLIMLHARELGLELAGQRKQPLRLSLTAEPPDSDALWRKFE